MFVLCLIVWIIVPAKRFVSWNVILYSLPLIGAGSLCDALCDWFPDRFRLFAILLILFEIVYIPRIMIPAFLH